MSRKVFIPFCLSFICFALVTLEVVSVGAGSFFMVVMLVAAIVERGRELRGGGMDR